MRRIGLVFLTASLSAALSAHAAPPRGLWHVTVHSNYFHDTYTTCNTGTARGSWMFHQPNEHCRLISWQQTGSKAYGREVCQAPSVEGEHLLVNMDIHVIFGPREQSYSGSVVARTHTPVGVVSTNETISARWLSPVCGAH